MKSYFLYAILCAQFFGSLAYSEVHCFSNEKEYEAIKSKLPPVLQELPLRVSVVGMMVAAVSEITFKEGKTRFFFNCSQQLAKPIEEDVTKICGNATEFQITFPNNEVEKVAIINETKLKVRNLLTLSKTAKAEFEGAKKKTAERAGNTSDVATRTTDENSTTGVNR